MSSTDVKNLNITKEQFNPEYEWANQYYYNANDAWEKLYYGLNDSGEECAPRGLSIRETLGCNIYVLNPNDNLVYSAYRGLSPIYLAGEYTWYKSGNRHVESIDKYGKFWDTIATDGIVNSNYGAYIFVKEKDGKSVWDKTVDILNNDRDSRQAIIQIPIMPFRGMKDTPCTSSIQFFIRSNQLFATVYQRSCDVVWGFPYDIYQFTMWQIELANELHVDLGWFRYVIGSLHVYEKDFISNRGKFFHTKRSCKYIPDKLSESYKNDINLLSEKKSEEVKDPMLKIMVRNKKIWK
jgi:thymidylate synthase